MILEEDKVRTIILSIDFHLMEECHKVLIEAEGKILGLFAQIITRKLRSASRARRSRMFTISQVLVAIVDVIGLVNCRHSI